MPTATIPSQRRAIWGWAFYDWANSAFITTVVVAFFPIVFRDYWGAGLDEHFKTLAVGIANALPGIAIILFAAFLGTLADQGGIKKPLLAVFVTLGVVATLGLAGVGHGQWGWAVATFALAVLGFLGANIFYDALLVDVAEKHEYHRVSALGYALGYLGGGLLFASCVVLTLHPAWFGISDKLEAVRWAFVLTACWWAVFALPLWLWVHEQRPARPHPPAFGELVRGSLAQLAATVHHIRQLRPVMLFLLAYWLYIDAVDTVIVMAVDYGKALGFANEHLIGALLVTQFVAFPAALAFGWIGNRLGAKRGIFLGLAGYVAIMLLAAQMTEAHEFYWLAAGVGLVQGGVQALSRSLYASLIPPDQAGEFFGFYNMLGKFAAILGPLLVGVVSTLTASHRMGLLAILVLFALGAWLLWQVPEKRLDSH